MRRIQLLALYTGLTAVAQTAQSSDKSVPLYVHVVDAVTGKPRDDVELFLQDFKWQPVAGPVKPDRAGQAEFRIPPNAYVLRAEGNTFTVHWGQLPAGTVHTVLIAAGDASKSVTFAVASPGSLSGYVHDAQGDPMQNVQVQLIRAFWNDGATVFQPTFSGQTDDRGYYRIAGIKPGAYILCGTPPQNLVSPETGPVDFAQTARRRYYHRTCTPAEPVSTSPSLLRIAPGQQPNIDLVLQAAPTVTVKGRVTGDFEGANLRLIPESLLRDVGFGPSSYAQSRQPEFAFPSVPPGRYRLEAEGQKRLESGGSETLFAAMPVEVGGADLDGLEVALQPAAAIDVTFEETETGLAEGVGYVGLRPAMQSSPALLAQDGKDKVRRFLPLREGAYWLHARTKEAGKKVCITGAHLGDLDVFRQPLVLTAGMNARLTLTLSTHCATISGRILLDGKPAPDARVVVLLRGTPENPGDCWITFLDSEGEFELWGIAPGSYPIWAWLDDDSGLAVGPPDLASVARFATVVTVREGEPAKPEINVLNLKERNK